MTTASKISPERKKINTHKEFVEMRGEGDRRFVFGIGAPGSRHHAIASVHLQMRAHTFIAAAASSSYHQSIDDAVHTHTHTQASDECTNCVKKTGVDASGALCVANKSYLDCWSSSSSSLVQQK
jgi:hypothetical protein